MSPLEATVTGMEGEKTEKRKKVKSAKDDLERSVHVMKEGSEHKKKKKKKKKAKSDHKGILETKTSVDTADLSENTEKRKKASRDDLEGTVHGMKESDEHKKTKRDKSEQKVVSETKMSVDSADLSKNTEKRKKTNMDGLDLEGAVNGMKEDGKHEKKKKKRAASDQKGVLGTKTSLDTAGLSENTEKGKKTKSVKDDMEGTVDGIKEGGKHKKKRTKSDEKGVPETKIIVDTADLSENTEKKKLKSVIDDIDGAVDRMKESSKHKKKRGKSDEKGVPETEIIVDTADLSENTEKKKLKSVIDDIDGAVDRMKESSKHKKKRGKSDHKGVQEMSVDTADLSENTEKGKKAKSVKDDAEGTVRAIKEGGKHKKRKRGKSDLEGVQETEMRPDTVDPSVVPKSKKTSKKVRFSNDVEVFPSSDGPTTGKNYQEKGLVQGKRFSPEEDEIVKEAVKNYIDEHGLGDDGVDKIMNCKKHPEVKHCWKEISLAIPWRPLQAVYYRAHILFERADERKWTPAEYEIIRRYHEQHGADWKKLAEALGKHRFHVKDTWRRIKYPNLKKGHWSQEEYQTLFDLVNMDIRLRVFEEKKTKYGMLRDNISWAAIGDKLATRINASCCNKWYNQLTSSMVAEGKWADSDDYRLVDALYNVDESCMENVDWDNLLEHRSGDVCRQRWKQMVKYIGEHGDKPFAEQVDVLYQRYSPDLAEAREAYESKIPDD